MRLKHFRVQHFRNVIDSNPVRVDDAVTSLVGKNESGKTALLQALERLNPSIERSFQVDEHYPRWLHSRHRKEGKVEQTPPISATFELGGHDKESLEARFGRGALPHEVTINRYYDGTLRCAHTSDEGASVRAFVQAASTSLPEEAYRRFLQADSFDQLRESITEHEASEGIGNEGNTDSEAALSELRDSLPKSFGNEVARAFISRMPEFFYFDQYSILAGRINLERLAGNTANDDPARSSDQTARSLLELADTDFEALKGRDYELRKSELETVSNGLTDEVFDYWTQNQNLSVYMDVEPRLSGSANNQKLERILQIRVRDEEHKYTGNFDQRSSGFKWFFSFLAAFTQFEREERELIVLLDEPALNLHGRAQADFLRFVDERLAPSVQVLYTTHSPFMVDTGRIERVRVVEDQGSHVGAKVEERVLSKDPDSLFPLQAALGYDIAQNLFIGPNNLVVEGSSDYAYLLAMSNIAESAGREPLDSRWRVLPVGGVTNVPSMVAFIGDHIQLTVLIDSGTSQSQRVEDQIRRGRLDTQRVVRVSDALAGNAADIEDLFTETEYLRLYNAAFASNTAKKDLPSGQRIVERITRLLGKFDHGQPADELMRNQSEYSQTFCQSTLDRWETLFRILNQRLAGDPQQ